MRHFEEIRCVSAMNATWAREKYCGSKDSLFLLTCPSLRSFYYNTSLSRSPAHKCSVSYSAPGTTFLLYTEN